MFQSAMPKIVWRPIYGLVRSGILLLWAVFAIGLLLSCDGANGPSVKQGGDPQDHNSPESISVVEPQGQPELPSTRPGYDVFLVIGQSNTHYGLGINPVLDTAPPRIFQLGRGAERDFKILPANEPLDHFTKQPDRIGFALSFAKLYQQDFLGADRKILIIPGGRGSTSLMAGSWKKGGDLYQNAVERVNYVLDTYPGSELKAVLWHQGESDYFNREYRRDLAEMISDFRSDLQGASNAPFVLGGLVPAWLREGAEDVVARKRIIQTTIQEISEHIEYTGFADSEKPEIRKYAIGSESIHFDAPGQRIMGERYYDAFQYAINNTLSPKAPDQVSELRVIGGDKSISVIWFAPRDNHDAIDGYIILYREEGSDAVRTLTIGAGSGSLIKHRIEGLENGKHYEISVAAFNTIGEGSPSDPVYATPNIAYNGCAFHLAFVEPDFLSECGQSSVVGGTLFRTWSGESGFKWFVAENRSDIGGIRTNAIIDGDYTKVLWFYLEPQGKLPKQQHLMSASYTKAHAFLVYPDGALAAGHNDDWNAVSTNPGRIAPLTWYHAAVVYHADESSLTLYLNGKPVAKGATTSIDVSDVMVGKHLNGGMKGRLFDIRLYSGIALNSQEIASIYEESKP